MEQRPILSETISPEQLPAEQLKAEQTKFVFQTKTVTTPPPVPFGFAAASSQAESSKPQDTLPDDGKAYFHQMLTQYWTFPTNDDDPSACIHFNLQAIGVIYGLVQKYKNDTLTWEDLYELETALLRVMPEAMLRSQAWTFRARYKEIAPATHFREYAKSKAVLGDEVALPTEMLRAELETLLSEMQKYRTFVPGIRAGSAHSQTLNVPWLAAGLLTAGLVFLILHFVSLASGAALAFTLVPVLISGALGGILSAENRRQTSIARKMALLDDSPVPRWKFSRAAAPLAGAFFAASLFFAFRTHALQGIIFPEASRAALSHPFTFAILIAWSFCAGFAERLVPNFLGFWERRFSQAKKIL